LTHDGGHFKMIKKYPVGTQLKVLQHRYDDDGEYHPYMKFNKIVTIIKSTRFPNSYNIKENGEMDDGWIPSFIEDENEFKQINTDGKVNWKARYS